METLTQRTAQFRAIERRLLTRFKDKTPVPLTNLDMLLEGTYKQVLLSCDQVESMHRDLDKSSANLSCIIRLLLMLAKLSLGLDDAELEKLEAALPPVIQTGQDQGWEETTDAGLTFLLRTALAKAGRENQGATPITLEYPKEISRLKKHVSSVMDRINKGSKVQDINVLPDSSPFVHEVIKDDSFDTEALEVVGRSIPEMTPAGTRFGESGERIRSARSKGLFTFILRISRSKGLFTFILRISRSKGLFTFILRISRSKELFTFIMRISRKSDQLVLPDLLGHHLVGHLTPVLPPVPLCVDKLGTYLLMVL
ncbi:protein PTHB1 isoform X1 [Eurytemora carolleeae]|uniref:protein PTHB1 isoform X1 n=1 Tax=Eurytemora carolleeae TaxID=1294199 RepID=UPI000C765DFC|nr:protein PTHB1 isoform X1 [Eurytemora carolleeae]|eukprot:XP_023334277.1 protein PTHB1-like isoform X1 [Eurytemora affinis]